VLRSSLALATVHRTFVPNLDQISAVGSASDKTKAESGRDKAVPDVPTCSFTDRAFCFGS
jgi:hypothetical protein